MAAPTSKGNQGPSSVEEGMNGVIHAITATMTAPDAAPHLPFLQQLMQASVGQLQKIRQPAAAPGGRPGGPPGGPPGMPPGGGMNLGALQGAPPGGPSAGAGGGPSPSGASAEDIRRMMGAQAGTPA